MNRVKQRARFATTDSEIRRRRWLPIDLDPSRPAGISATDAERQAAFEKAEEIKKFLTTQGFHEPVYADSGNGAHLLYRIDLPNDEASTQLLKQFLRTLDEKFTDDFVTLDRKVFNAARIFKLYGTLAAKGDPTEDRPHRLAKLINVPSKLEIVSEELISSVIPKKSPASKRRRSDFDLRQWIERNDIKFIKEKDWEGGTLFELDSCPFRPSEKDGGPWMAQSGDGSLAAGCHHNKCVDKGWKDFKNYFDPGSGEKPPKQAEQLFWLADRCEFYRTSDDEALIKIKVADHFEVCPVKSRHFEKWLRKQSLDEGLIPTGDAVRTAIATVETLALAEGKLVETFVRIGHADDEVWVDLCDEEWRAIRVTAKGWSIEKSVTIVFQRHRGMLPLAEPSQSGSFEPLRELLNLRDEDWPLIIGWLIGTYNPFGPYPILMLNAEQGAAKSTTARLLRMLIDPNMVSLRSISRNEQDLMIAARNARILAFDNLSTLSQSVSDALCRLSTGGGFATRKLYSDTDETMIDVQRPAILTGISDIATQPDLLDRCLIIQLPAISPGKRRTESEIKEEFAKHQSTIMAAIFDAVSCALANFDSVEISELPRMADFVRWVTAAEPKLGFKPGTFVESYNLNRESANEIGLESSLIYKPLLELGNFDGTTEELLNKISESLLSDPDKFKADAWPKTPAQLSNQLRLLAPSLREAGFEIEQYQTSGSNSRKKWKIHHLRDV